VPVLSTPSLRPLNGNWTDSGVLDALYRLAAQHKEVAFAVQKHVWVFMECWKEALAISKMNERDFACMRLKIGAELEASAVSKSKLLHNKVGSEGELAQLYFDSYCAAVWNSAHAEFIACVDSGIDNPTPPNIFTVPSAFTTIDLSDLYARRNHPRSCSKESGPLLQLIARATNPGARGWNSVLESSMKTAGVKRIITREYELCLSGMHPQIHPAMRPDWKHRFTIIRLASEKCSNDATNSCILDLPVQSKEVIKRMLASVMSNSIAMHTALSALGHPVRHLHQPPMALPHKGMESAMVAFVDAGLDLCVEEKSLSCAISSSFDIASKKTDNFQFFAGWLGKGTIDVPSRTTLVNVASDVWTSTFKSNFMSLWVHGMTKKIRISRLDHIQHSAVHGINSVTMLCAALPQKEQLAIQRIALQDPASATKTVGEVARALGVPLRDFSQTFKNATEFLNLLCTIGSYHSARLFSYARVAWIKDQVLSVNLPFEVGKKQVAALKRRLKFDHNIFECSDPIAEAYKIFPQHATCLCVCTDCQRVSNAHAMSYIKGKNDAIFNEIGVRQAMISWTQIKDGERGCLRCARRSSAALRSSVAFQEFMLNRCIEEDQIDEKELQAFFSPRTASSVESGVAARVRRDCKNALEQRAVTKLCGDANMLMIPLIGKAVRIFDCWFAHCTFCGAVTCVTSVNRIGSNICCLKCDDKLCLNEQGVCIFNNGPISGTPQVKSCRYCGMIDPERSGARWKQVKAPLDVAGINASLPPPLRRVYYCPTHHRSWISGAHRVLQTKVILAHIAVGAKPIRMSEVYNKGGTA